MSARFDAEVMEYLEKLYREQLSQESARPPSAGVARMSFGERAAFASPGQNPVAVFQEDISALQRRMNSDDVDSLNYGSSDVVEDLANEKILQPRKLSLRVF